MNDLPNYDLQALAWIGDGVLALFARRWLLAQGSGLDARQFTAMTSNRFLSARGQPTVVEAKIGRIYLDEGIEAAFAWIEAELLPMYQRQEAKRRKQGRV